MIKRFVSATQACLCHIMSTERVVSDLHEITLLYLDAMVEIAHLLLIRLMPDNKEFKNNDNEDNTLEDLIAITNEPTTTTVRKKRQPNFVKSNSLGWLVVANTHSYHGPATLNWEGGWHGERKIQQVKPALLHIKWSNAEWETVILRWLYQHETIQRLLDDCVREEQNENQNSIEIEAALKVYGSCQMAEEAILHNQPITAVLDHKDILHIQYRPIGRANTIRSSIELMEIRCDDNEGMMIQNLFWVCPIHSTNNIITFESLYLIKTNNFIKEFVLMLPTLNEDNGQDSMNNYYCIGHTWTE